MEIRPFTCSGLYFIHTFALDNAIEWDLFCFTTIANSSSDFLQNCEFVDSESEATNLR